MHKHKIQLRRIEYSKKEKQECSVRFSDLCEKEVVNVKDCRCLGSVRDLDIDKECGRILALIVPGPGKYLGCFAGTANFLFHGLKLSG